MKTVEIYQKMDQGYDEVCKFASGIYEQQLSFTITRFPEYFFAIKDETKIVGCIGLNAKLTSALFLNDARVSRVVSENADGARFCEQSIFALDQYAPGIPILISVVTEYAHSLDLDKLVYAGTDSFRKIIAHLGFPVIECGPVDLSILPRAEQKKYELWQATQNPVTCILDSKEAPRIAQATLRKYSHRVRKSEALTASLLQNQLRSGHREAA